MSRYLNRIYINVTYYSNYEPNGQQKSVCFVRQDPCTKHLIDYKIYKSHSFNDPFSMMK